MFDYRYTFLSEIYSYIIPRKDCYFFKKKWLLFWTHSATEQRIAISALVIAREVGVGAFEF